MHRGHVSLCTSLACGSHAIIEAQVGWRAVEYNMRLPDVDGQHVLQLILTVLVTDALVSSNRSLQPAPQLTKAQPPSETM